MGLDISEAKKLKIGLAQKFMSVAGFEGFGIGGASDSLGCAIEVYIATDLSVEAKEEIRAEAGRILGREVPRNTFSYITSAPSTDW